jgi:hypothetical protein
MAAKTAPTWQASTTDTEKPSHQPFEEPLREISGLEPHMFDAAAHMMESSGDRIRLARRTRVLDYGATVVDDADVHLIVQLIKTNKKLHGLNSLIG